MTHPAIYAITLALGAAVFAFFAAAQFRQENPHRGYNNDSRYERSNSGSWGGGSKNKTVGDVTCSICLEDIDKGAGSRLPCKHEFHGKCLAELKKQSHGSNSCPNCRKSF